MSLDLKSVVFWVITRRRVVIIYHTTPCNYPEDHRFHQYRGGSLKSRSLDLCVRLLFYADVRLSVPRHFYKDHHDVTVVILHLLADDELYKKELLLI
jgi:hypothetical protein